MNIWEQVTQELACSHEQREVRYLITSDGRRQYRLQCTSCGEMSGNIKQTDPRVMAAVNPGEVDRLLQEGFWTKVRAEVTRRQQLERDQEQTAWWSEYSAYLESGDWQERRRMVLERDNYVCQACRKARATHAHHLSYDHIGAEPLFELVAICRDCHERLTEMDRKRRGAVSAGDGPVA